MGIGISKALDLWNEACATKWNKAPVWIHGNFAIGHMLMDSDKLSAITDFSGAVVDNPGGDFFDR